MTFRTQTVPSQVCESIRRVRAQGYAIGDRVLTDQLRAIAVPVHDARGTVVAAMVAMVKAERLTEEVLRASFLPALTDAARDAGQRWR